jgi:hypothetical protein
MTMTHSSSRREAPKKPQTLREVLDLILRTLGETGTSDDVPVTRMYGQVFTDELEAAEKHHGRRLLAYERDLLEPLIGRGS